MQIENLSLVDFFSLDNEKRIEYQTYYEYINYEIDCKQWSYGDVKECQYMLSKGVTYQNIMDIASLHLKEPILSYPAHLVFGVFNGILKSINEISEIENNANGHIPTSEELIASEEVGGFEVFGYLPELDRLANGDILKYEEIKKLKWEDCFSKLTYELRQAKYGQKINELIRNKQK